MTYQGALSNPILARIGVSLIGQGPPAITRTFITLDSVQQERYILENPVTYNGSSATISFDLVFSASGVNQYVLDGTEDGLNRLYVLVLGLPARIDMPVAFTGTRDGVVVDLGAAGAVPDDGVLHRYTLTFSTTLTFAKIGARFGNIHFYGNIIANMDLGSGNAWPLDVLTGNTQQAVNGNNELTLVNIPEGSPDRELFTLNISTDPDQWENADKTRIIQVA